jgi:hypothetical protein
LIKNIFKKVIFIILLGVINFGIVIIEWSHIEVLNIFLAMVFISSTMAILYLGYELFREIDISLKKRFKNAYYRYISSKVSMGILFLAIFLGANFIYLLVYLFTPRYIKEYSFKEKKIYIYDNSFISYCIQVDINNGVVREKLISICNEYNTSLFQKDSIVYLKTYGRGDIKIYDLKSGKKLYIGE